MELQYIFIFLACSIIHNVESNLLGNISAPVEFFEIKIDREHPEELYKAFEEFITKYKRDYKTLEEKEYRFNNFVRSFNKVSELKKESEAAGMDTKFGINKFSDYGDSEFKDTLLQSPPANASNLPTFDSFRDETSHRTRRKRQTYPNELNLATMKKNGRYIIGPIKNQGSCACCWGFAITALSETANALINGKYTALSDQELCDCGTTGTPGCKGGSLENGLEYISRYGQTTENAYPYSESRATRAGQCNLRKTNRFVQPGKLRYFGINPRRAEEQMIEVLYRYNVPVTVSFKAGQSFKAYYNGVLELEDCTHSSDWHAGAIVGYGSVVSRGKTKYYWLVRNSWDTDWGEDGYFRVPRGVNWCGIEDNPISGDLNNKPSSNYYYY